MSITTYYGLPCHAASHNYSMRAPIPAGALSCSVTKSQSYPLIIPPPPIPMRRFSDTLWHAVITVVSVLMVDFILLGCATATAGW